MPCCSDFQENMCSAFSTLRDDTTFTDVTLVSEDGQHLQAHKVILSASSPFFKNILMMNKHPSPLIYLKGFKAKELKSLIDFMYHGMADVYQDNLDDFLAKAEELQLQGLTGGEKEKNKEEKEVTNHFKPKMKTANKTEIATEYPKNEFEEVLSDSTQTTSVLMVTSQTSQVYFNGGTGMELKATIRSLISQNGSVLTCTVCGKSKDKNVARNAFTRS